MKPKMSTHCLQPSLVLLAALFSACGDTKDKETPALVVSGSLTLSDSKTTDAATFSLTTIEKCSRNADSGRVDVVLSQGVGKPSLSFAIKDYSSTPKTYTCKQSTDNKDSLTDVGGKFESCMVDVKVLSSATASTLNGYSMYREVATTKPFSFTDSCSIALTAATPNISGTLTCTNLIQTALEGAARNPIDASVTADLKADFNCTFR